MNLHRPVSLRLFVGAVLAPGVLTLLTLPAPPASAEDPPARVLGRGRPRLRVGRRRRNSPVRRVDYQPRTAVLRPIVFVPVHRSRTGLRASGHGARSNERVGASSARGRRPGVAGSAVDDRADIHRSGLGGATASDSHERHRARGPADGTTG